MPKRKHTYINQDRILQLKPILGLLSIYELHLVLNKSISDDAAIASLIRIIKLKSPNLDVDSLNLQISDIENYLAEVQKLLETQGIKFQTFLLSIANLKKYAPGYITHDVSRLGMRIVEIFGENYWKTLRQIENNPSLNTIAPAPAAATMTSASIPAASTFVIDLTTPAFPASQSSEAPPTNLREFLTKVTFAEFHQIVKKSKNKGDCDQALKNQYPFLKKEDMTQIFKFLRKQGITYSNLNKMSEPMQLASKPYNHFAIAKALKDNEKEKLYYKKGGFFEVFNRMDPVGLSRILGNDSLTILNAEGRDSTSQEDRNEYDWMLDGVAINAISHHMGQAQEIDAPFVATTSTTTTTTTTTTSTTPRDDANVGEYAALPNSVLEASCIHQEQLPLEGPVVPVVSTSNFGFWNKPEENTTKEAVTTSQAEQIGPNEYEWMVSFLGLDQEEPRPKHQKRSNA